METPRQQAVIDLRAAADHILTYGWLQGAYSVLSLGSHSPACALGALSLVVESGNPYSTAAHAELMDHVGGFVSDWNDTPGRTAGEVVEALLATAKELEES